MRRREFIALLSSGVVGWPLAARVQQARKLPTIGYLGASAPTGQGQWLAAFVERLRELGWIEGRAVAIEVRWAENRAERYAEIAAEFVRLKVDIIVTAGRAVVAAKAATAVIPIVFAVASDPLGSGLVASLARPGGNVTGLSVQVPDVAGKRVELLRELVPGFRTMAIMANVGYPAAVLEMGEVQAAARTLGLEGHHSRNPASGGYRVRFRDAQEPRRSTLCLCRSAHRHQSDSHQRLGVRRATADDFRFSRGPRSRRFDFLWTKRLPPVPARRGLCR
jgi:ABC transporter substrate binding protein